MNKKIFTIELENWCQNNLCKDGMISLAHVLLLLVWFIQSGLIKSILIYQIIYFVR